MQQSMKEESVSIEEGRRSERERSPAPDSETSAAAPQPARGNVLVKIKSVFRRVGRPLVRRLVGPVRRFLVDHLEARLDNLQTVQHDMIAKLDDLQRRSRELEGVTNQLSGLDEQLSAIRRKIDDIMLKVRGPLELEGGSLAVRTADGYAIVPRRDATLMLMLNDAELGLLEPGTRAVLREILTPGATFVDVGAHVGLMTLAGARAVGPGGRVFAFEASPTTFALLERTIALSHGTAPVIARSVAVGRASERRILHEREVLGHSSLHDFSTADQGGTVAETEVNVRPLDELMPEGEPVHVVKIDVEGAELDVLAGMPRILANNPQITVIAEFGPSHLARTGITPEMWFDAFAAHGFDAYAVDEMTGSCRPVGWADVANVDSVNIVFVAPFSAAAEVMKQRSRLKPVA